MRARSPGRRVEGDTGLCATGPRRRSRNMADRIRLPFKAAMVVTLFAVLVALVLPSPAAAQALYGSIVGNVSDDSGAPVPGATVTATNPSTGSKVDTITDQE